MKKFKLYVVAKTKEYATREEFDKSIVTFLSNKKHLKEFLLNRCIQEHIDHYNRWRELKELEDSQLNRVEYIRNCVNFIDFANEYCVRTYTYTVNELASIFRLTTNCVPTLSSYETKQEHDAWRKIQKLMEQMGLDKEEENEE